MIGGYAAALGYAAGWTFTRRLPARLAGPVFRAGADLVSRSGGRGVRRLRANLRRVCPDLDDAALDRLTRDGMRSYARYWCEVFRLPSMDHEGIAHRVRSTVEGLGHLDDAVASGRGVVLVLPHTGNWDAAGVWLARHLGGFTTVAARARPDSLYRRFVEYRRSLGFEILPLTGDARSLGVLTTRLRAGGVVCLLADLDLTDNGVPVDFFGEELTMPSGPARLARATGAVLLPARTWFTPLGWAVRFHRPIPVCPGPDGVAGAVRRMAGVFERDIAAAPQDWHMLQPIWPADRGGS